MGEPSDFENIGIRDFRDCKRLALFIRSLQVHLADKGLLEGLTSSCVSSINIPLLATPITRHETSFSINQKDKDAVKKALAAFDRQVLPSLYMTCNSPPLPNLAKSKASSGSLSALKTVRPSPSFSSGKMSIQSTSESSEITMFDGSDDEQIPLTEPPAYTPSDINTPLIEPSPVPKRVPLHTRARSLPDYLRISPSSAVQPPTSVSLIEGSGLPDYHEYVLQRRLERFGVIPREEEGSELLPGYKCTIFKMGHVFVKREFDKPGVRSRRRGWRKLYLEIWGTVLRIYRASPKEATSGSRSRYRLYRHWHKYYHTPIKTISLAGADATRALDYTKRPNSLRLTTNGPQYLLRLPTVGEMTMWVDSLQAAINISLDLEHRPMPKFLTMPARAQNISNLDTRMLAIERARQQRLRDQAEVLI
ncbi:hypothetical protein CLU79DRAFT_727976 [Phycomyces nitens]|nr:hypothetical protein CLU79DRAFT_727976 [Phycomyces nitens]